MLGFIHGANSQRAKNIAWAASARCSRKGGFQSSRHGILTEARIGNGRHAVQN